jgi:dephospho-CoA kinase
MQTERVTILMTPAKKASLAARAARRNMSTGEFLRRAIDQMPDEDAEIELTTLIGEANRAIPKMAESLQRVSERLESIHLENDAFLRKMGVRQ